MIPSIICYAVECKETIPGDHLFCPNHWAMLPQSHRQAIQTAHGPDYWPTVLKAVDKIEAIEVAAKTRTESEKSLEEKLCTSFTQAN